MDIETAYFLKLTFYTVKAIVYSLTHNEEYKSIIRVVKPLSGPSTGNYFTLYIDRLYTLMELLRELYYMSLFDAGTCMNYFITKDLTTESRSLR